MAGIKEHHILGIIMYTTNNTKLLSWKEVIPAKQLKQYTIMHKYMYQHVIIEVPFVTTITHQQTAVTDTTSITTLN